MRQVSAATVVLILLLAHVTSVAAPSPSKAGSKIITSLVKELVDIGDYANRNGFPVTAKAYIDEALVFAPEDKRAIKISEKIKDGGDATTEKAISKFNRRAKKANKKIATGYLNLFKEYIPDKDTATVNGYLASAFRYDREVANEYIDREATAAFGRKDFTTTHRLLDVAAPIVGELEDKVLQKRKDMMVKCVVVLSQKGGLQKTATTHKMQYLLGLPKDWSADKKWPIVFACSGAGCGWRSTYNSANKLSDGEFIVVTPMTFSNTNAILKSKYPYPAELIDEWENKRIAFDEPGILAIFEDIKELYNGQNKFCITGYSGGGIATWTMALKHPELLHCACPGSGNFSGVSGVSAHEARKALTIHAFQGEDDKHLAALTQQWEAAKKVCSDNGFENVKRTMVPGGHIRCHGHAFAEFRKVLEAADKK